MELQTHGTIGTRLLQYCIGFYEKYGLAVISIVLYPFQTAVEPPEIHIVDAEGKGVHFDYRELHLWKIEAQPFVDKHAVYLYSLLPAMKGANAALLKQALKEMKQRYTQRTFGHYLVRFEMFLQRSSTLAREDKLSVEEELLMYYKYDYFIDENPQVIKRVEKRAKEALDAGVAKGKVEGKIEGKAEGLRQSVLLIVSSRFPDLVERARPVVERITESEELQRLIVHLAVATSETEASELLNLPAM